MLLAGMRDLAGRKGLASWLGSQTVGSLWVFVLAFEVALRIDWKDWLRVAEPVGLLR
jgi:hypothetical protein